MNLNNSEKPLVVCLRFALRHASVRGFLQSIILLPRQGHVLRSQAFNFAGSGV